MTDGNQFLQEGFERYIEAKTVLHRFEELLGKRIRDAVTARNNWGCFIRDTENRSVKVKNETVGGHQWPAVFVKISGKVDKKAAVIIVGVLWSKDTPLVFARFRKHKQFSIMDSTIRKKNVRMIESKNKKRFLSLELTDPGNIDDDLNTVLDELLRFTEVIRKAKKSLDS